MEQPTGDKSKKNNAFRLCEEIRTPDPQIRSLSFSDISIFLGIAARGKSPLNTGP
jgi:hypothetical protein